MLLSKLSVVAMQGYFLKAAGRLSFCSYEGIYVNKEYQSSLKMIVSLKMGAKRCLRDDGGRRGHMTKLSGECEVMCLLVFLS